VGMVPDYSMIIVGANMGISRMTLYRRMKRYGIEHPQ
jgi:transcriptional regulator of acetoin/glycerol metabolism